MRILYTFHAKDYQTTIYANPSDILCIYWVCDKGLVSEGSGLRQVAAHECQNELYKLENADHYLVESISHA